MGKYSAARDLDLRNKTKWYVIANRTDAVFYADNKDFHFRFLGRLENKKGRRPELMLVSDRPGRVMSSAAGTKKAHVLSRKMKHHEVVAEKFARRIARVIEAARLEERFGELILVAEPHFLGLLRTQLSPAARAMIKHEVNHEYTRGSDQEIRARVLKSIEASA